MAHIYRDARHDSVVRGYSAGDHIMITVARIVSFMGGVLLSLLAMRFVLSLLGANPANVFASFIYNVTHPFVAPFFSLFNYQEQFGAVRFEFETLVAMLFWGAVTWMITRLVTLGVHNDEI